MSTKREDILDRVVAALAGTTGVSTRIYRTRVEGMSRAEHPSLVIQPVSDTPDRQARGRLVWQLVFQVQTWVRATDGTLDASADDTVADVHSKIIGDATLNGMLVDLLPGPSSWAFEDADKPLCVVTQQFIAQYQTSETSLAAL